jgi:hypothetical protein
MRKIKVAVLLFLTALAPMGPPVLAQSPAATPQPAADEKAAAEKAALERQAYELLDEVVSEAQGLRLAENRARVQAAAADLLWKRDEGRARALFAEAAATVAEAMRQSEGAVNDRRGFGQAQTAMQLRQEVVLAAARRDAQLAYQLFQSLRRPVVAQTAADSAGVRGARLRDDESFLEERLLALVAATDPAAALRRAEESLDRGEYPGAISSVLAQLQSTDKQVAARLTGKLTARLQPDTLLSSREAAALAMTLLRPGPRPADAQTGGQNPPAPTLVFGPVGFLADSSYRDLLESAIAAALKAAANTQTTLTTAVGPAAQGNAGRVRGAQGGQRRAQPAAAAAQPQTDAQARQNNARLLLGNLRNLLPQIDQYLPARSAAVRQKLTELGMGDGGGGAVLGGFGRLAAPTQQNTVDAMLSAAESAPQGLRERLYQRAAMRAASDGDLERARQIADTRLNENMRAPVARVIEEQQTLRKTRVDQIEEVRQTLARLATDEERVRLLLQLSESARVDNPKQSLQFLGDARTLVARRAANYQQLEGQLQVARAYAAVDAAQSFELIELGIGQLNELLPAAALLSGFELNVFREGEMALPGNSMLGQMVARYGQELGALSRQDFERARSTANRFQYPEARVLARLAIVRSALGAQTPPAGGRFTRRPVAPAAPAAPRPQQ